MLDKTNPPWWFELFPDVRGWATIGAFGLAFYILHLIATVPELATNELFKTAVVLLLGTGGLGLVYAFLWGGSKASVSAVDTVNAMATQAQTVTPANPLSVTVENTPANPVPVEDPKT